MSKIELPDYLKDLTDDKAKDMISIGGSVPRISIRGRQFRFMVDGVEESKTTDPIHVVILGVVPSSLMAKTFYINGYQPGSTDPPDCSSFFGEQPDNWIDAPQADNCRNCPQNVWGSATAMSGKKAKACKDSKRLMVIKAEDLKEETPIVYIFNVTVASLKALTEHGKFLVANNLPMAAVISTLAFVDSEFPQVEFTYQNILAEKFGRKSLEMSAAAPWMITNDTPKIAAPADRKQIPTTSPVQAQAQPDSQGPPPPNDADVPQGDPLDNWT